MLRRLVRMLGSRGRRAVRLCPEEVHDRGPLVVDNCLLFCGATASRLVLSCPAGGVELLRRWHYVLSRLMLSRLMLPPIAATCSMKYSKLRMCSISALSLAWPSTAAGFERAFANLLAFAAADGISNCSDRASLFCLTLAGGKKDSLIRPLGFPTLTEQTVSFHLWRESEESEGERDGTIPGSCPLPQEKNRLIDCGISLPFRELDGGKGG